MTPICDPEPPDVAQPVKQTATASRYTARLRIRGPVTGQFEGLTVAAARVRARGHGQVMDFLAAAVARELRRQASEIEQADHRIEGSMA